MARRRTPIVFATLIVLAGVGLIGTAVYGKLGDKAKDLLSGAPLTSPSASASLLPPPPPSSPTLQTASVQTPTPAPKLFAWAFYDRRTGQMTGSANSTKSVNYTESMLKVWLVSDYLRRLGTKQPSKTALKYTSTAIRNSNDDSANWLWSQDGRYATLTRLTRLCGLKTVKSDPRYWSQTTMTAQDAVRMGLCVADGRAAGPQWTEYVLEQMRHTQGTTAAKDQQVRTGGGHWGIIDGLPDNLQPEVSIKNGWTMHFSDSRWHVNCLALHADWVLAVQTQIPANNAALGQKDEVGLKKAAAVCAAVAEQLTVTPTATAP